MEEEIKKEIKSELTLLSSNTGDCDRQQINSRITNLEKEMEEFKKMFKEHNYKIKKIEEKLEEHNYKIEFLLKNNPGAVSKRNDLEFFVYTYYNIPRNIKIKNLNDIVKNFFQEISLLPIYQKQLHIFSEFSIYSRLF